IRQEYQHKLTISLLSQRVGINECYLKQQFKQQTGKTIGQFIRELRMQEAMRLLLDEYKSVQETAWYVGYHDPSNFSKAFAKFYGVTPTQLI
ncbi:MAG: helix-turn-helix domain-containing protein, partial [Psychrobacter sp.]